MKIGDKIFIVNGPHESTRTTVLNVLDNGSVLVRINNVDVMIKRKDYVKSEVTIK